MEQEDAHHTISVHPAEGVGLPFRHMDEPQDEQQEEQQHRGTADESLLLAHGAEDEVGVLLGHILELRLGTVEETLAFQTARPYGNLCLNHIVSGTTGVILQSQQHPDAHLLMRLQHLGEHMVGRIEEPDRADGKEGDVEIAEQPFAQRKVKEIQHHARHHTPLHIGNVERQGIAVGTYGQQQCQQAIGQHLEGRHAQSRVHQHQPHREQMDEQQHTAFAQPRGRVLPQGHIGIADAHYKIDDCRHCREKDAPRHSVTVHHQEETQVHQRRPRLLLQDDEHHRRKHQNRAHDKVPETVHAEVEGSDDLGHTQGCAELGELGRLDAQGTHLYPGQGALDVVGQERSDEQHHEETYIYKVGKRLYQPVIGGQNDGSQHQRCAYPYYLHAGPGAEIKEVAGLVEVIACATHAHPAHGQQCAIKQDGKPVERPPHALAIGCWGLRHNEWGLSDICRNIFWPVPPTRGSACH